MAKTKMRRSTVRFSIVGLVALLVAACTKPTPYEPMSASKYGYSEQRLEENRYRVTFAGNSATDRDTVENYLLYRAAELTKAGGFDHFELVERDTDRSSTYHGSGPSVGVLGGRRRGGVGWTLGTSYDFVETERRYTAVANIVMHHGEKPADNSAAYSAKEVLEHLQPTIVRPET